MKNDISDKTKESLVYAVDAVGHRGSYVETLTQALKMTPLVARMTRKIFLRMYRAEKVVFATLDDDMFSFFAIAITRSIMGRPTFALFLRAAKCFESKRPVYLAKRLVFCILRRIPNLTIATIMPFNVEPRYTSVAHYGLHDPQLWDMLDKGGPRPSDSGLSETIANEAKGRPIVCLPGSLSSIKGFQFLAETLVEQADLNDKVLFVAAGLVSQDMTTFAKRFSAAGGLLIDRKISDLELESIYTVSDLIWCCYMPEYDQASGIFGRAVQFGVPTVVRKGSQLERFSRQLDIPVYSVAFTSHVQVAQILNHIEHRSLKRQLSVPDIDKIHAWRREFLCAVRRAFGECD